MLFVTLDADAALLEISVCRASTIARAAVSLDIGVLAALYLLNAISNSREKSGEESIVN